MGLKEYDNNGLGKYNPFTGIALLLIFVSKNEIIQLVTLHSLTLNGKVKASI